MPDLKAILLADSLNPVLFAFMVYVVGTDRPVTNPLAALTGHTVAYLAFGILLALARINHKVDGAGAVLIQRMQGRWAWRWWRSRWPISRPPRACSD